MSPRDGLGCSRATSLLRTPAALVTALAVALLVLLVAPGTRHQLALSVQRMPASYLAVYFDPGQHTPSCGSGGRPVSVGFALRSDLTRPELVRYVVEAAPRGTGTAKTGRVRLAPGQVAHVQRTVVTPGTGRFRVVVALPGRSEGLRLQCRPQGRP